MVVKIAGYEHCRTTSTPVTERKHGDTYLVIKTISNIPGLEREDEPHRVCDIASPHVLFTSHTDIDEDPEDKTWPEFIERFDVKPANRRVQFPSDEELETRVIEVSTQPFRIISNVYIRSQLKGARTS